MLASCGPDESRAPPGLGRHSLFIVVSQPPGEGWSGLGGVGGAQPWQVEELCLCSREHCVPRAPNTQAPSRFGGSVRPPRERSQAPGSQPCPGLTRIDCVTLAKSVNLSVLPGAPLENEERTAPSQSCNRSHLRRRAGRLSAPGSGPRERERRQQRCGGAPAPQGARQQVGPGACSGPTQPCGDPGRLLGGEAGRLGVEHTSTPDRLLPTSCSDASAGQ